jgi:hypothetical protein
MRKDSRFDDSDVQEGFVKTETCRLYPKAAVFMAGICHSTINENHGYLNGVLSNGSFEFDELDGERIIFGHF